MQKLNASKLETTRSFKKVTIILNKTKFLEKIEELEKVKKNLEEKGIKVDSSSLDWVPREEVSLDEKAKEACQKLFEALDENEAVQEIYSNLKV